jgi:energy-coupling factor transporter ATP-binding protein EcfA2
MRFFGYYKILKNGSFLIISYINKLLSMRTIVFATHKGGCGKSTLATCLAVAAQEAGESVAIFDLDPKNCAIRWSSKRIDRKPPVRTIAFARLSPALNAAAKRNVTLSIIDTPAFPDSACRSEARRSHDRSGKTFRARYLGGRCDRPPNEIFAGEIRIPPQSMPKAPRIAADAG